MAKIYLDQASTSYPKAPSVAQAVYDYLNGSAVNVNRGGYQAAYSVEEQIFETREQLLRLFHFTSGKGKNVIFTPNITTSLNILLKGLLKSGDHVLVSSMEHNAVMRPLVQLTQHGVTFDRIPCSADGSLLIEKAEELLKPNTRLLVCLHASNVCGTMMPVQELGKFCKKHGLLFILDTAQTAGTVPIDMEALQLDALAFTGHKGLMGPQGTGGIYVREGVKIAPLKVGGSGVKSFDKEHPDTMPTALEAGTLNGPGIAGLGASLSWILKQGVEQIHEKELSLARSFLKGIAEIPDITVYGDTDAQMRTAIVSLNLGDVDSAEVSDWLWEDYGIAVRAGAHCAPLMHKALGTEQQGAVRFSFSCFNTEEEVDAAIQALKELQE